MKPDGSESVSAAVQATYFHLNKNCVRKVIPLFEIADIVIHDEVINTLSEGQKQVLQNFGVLV